MGKLLAFVNEGERIAKDDKLELGDVLNYLRGIVVPQLQEVVKEICHEIEQHHKLDTAEVREPNFVHYTSIGALFAMLQSAAYNLKPSLRMYDSVHFNDPEEGDYLIKQLAREEHSWLKDGLGLSSHAYIVSLVAPDTKNRAMDDELVFWRTYGREGEGCSLKVRVPHSRLRRVFYGTDSVEIAEQRLKPILKLLDELANTRKEIGETLAKAFCESLEGIQYLYKNEAYSYENECRFLMYRSEISDDRICFEYRENSPTTIRHYYEHEELRIRELLLSGSKITIGPCVPNRDDLHQVLEVLKRKANMLGPIVYCSQVPYRKV